MNYKKRKRRTGLGLGKEEPVGIRKRRTWKANVTRGKQATVSVSKPGLTCSRPLMLPPKPQLGPLWLGVVL